MAGQDWLYWGQVLRSMVTTRVPTVWVLAAALTAKTELVIPQLSIDSVEESVALNQRAALELQRPSVWVRP